MAFSAKQISIFLILATLLSSLQTHARESQFFNKVPSATTNNVVPTKKEASNNQQEQEEPNFLPQNENGYGLYGHESGQLSPSTTGEPAATTPLYTESKQPAHHYLPKNYNPVAYVTKPADVNDDSPTLMEESSYATNPTNFNNNYYDGARKYYKGQQQEESLYRSYPTTTNNNYHYNGGGRFNSQPQGLSDTRYSGGERYFNNGGEANGFQPQGMSDTRLLENGKYHFDVNTGRYSSNHPYESLRGVRARNEYDNGNYYGNDHNNAYPFNSGKPLGGYEEEENNQP